MRSMTGYGKGTASSAGLTVTAEIKTVNHKFFDWNMKMPKGFLFVEDDAKKAVAGAVSRGHVDLYLTVEKQTAEAGEYRADAALARMYVDSARQLSETLGVPFDITASSLMKNPDIVTLSETEIDDETVRKVTLEAVSEAVSALVAMREREGAALAADLSEKLASIEASLEEVKKEAPRAVAEYRRKLRARIDEALGQLPLDEARLATEVALFADKCAIDEEISRLGAHIAAMRALISSQGQVGRKLDFLVQEMNRETNTIGSKANDLAITERVLAMKNDIEKIREQAQNAE